jgi:sortase (surface protein transpeptidase)
VVNVIADLAGYYTGQPANGLWPKPTNPEPPPPQLPYTLTVPRLGWTAWVYGGGDANRVVDAGHVWHWSGTGLLGQRSNMALFAHRTEANSLLRYQHYLRPGDEIILTSNDGRKWRYVYGYDWVTDAQATNILAATRFWSGPTISLISCTKPNKLPTDLKWRLITTFTFDRWYE